MYKHFLDQLETTIIIPDEKELESIYTAVIDDDSKCNGVNHWTSWNNIGSPTENDGNDYELLADHIRWFK